MADKTVTVRPSGGTYTSLQAAITGEVTANANLVTMDGILTISIEGTWSSADTTVVNVTGFTTDSTHYVKIVADSSNRAGTSWDTGKYRISIGSHSTLFTVNQNYTRVIGIQIEKTANYANSVVECPNTCTNFILDSILVKSAGSQTVYSIVIVGDTGNRADKILVNCVVLLLNTSGSYGFYTWNTGGLVSFYNCVAIGSNNAGSYGFILDQYRASALKNCYSGNFAADYESNSSPSVFTDCYSEDGSESTSTAAYSTSTFTSVTSGSEDFSLVSGSDLIGAGTDLSADATYPFDWDITGATRTTWDVGAAYFESAVEIVCAGTPSTEASGSPTIELKTPFTLESYSGPTITAVNFAIYEIGTTPATGITCAGTPSTAASGSPSISSAISCTGTATTEASGQPTIAVAGATISCAGTPSAEASGPPSIGAGITTAGTATAAASGSPSVGAGITAAGTPTSAASGSPAIGAGIFATGTATTAASGTPSISLSITCTGTASSEASGQPTISVGGGTISCQGTPSSEASGSPALSVSISCSGTGTGEASGAPSIGADITAIGTPTTAANGSPAIGARITTAGTASAAASGNPIVSVSINAAGTPSSEISGTPAISANITTTGTASSEASGHPTIYTGGFGHVVSGGTWRKAMEAKVIIGGNWHTVERAYAIIASDWEELT